jgi:hypothetical protein
VAAQQQGNRQQQRVSAVRPGVFGNVVFCAVKISAGEGKGQAAHPESCVCLQAAVLWKKVVGCVQGLHLMAITAAAAYQASLLALGQPQAQVQVVWVRVLVA